MAKPLVISAIVVLGGCAASYTEPTPSSNHPASPGAEQSPPPTHWRTLDLAGADPVTPAQVVGGMNHGGHTAGDKPTPDPTGAGEHADAHKQDAPPTPDGAAVTYACPMHPEVTSDKPDERCPKCGMKLKPVSKPGGTR